MASLLQIFTETGLAPHGFCLLWQPGLVWLYVISDAVIGLSYYASWPSRSGGPGPAYRSSW
jgi:hypothetical protein